VCVCVRERERERGKSFQLVRETQLMHELLLSASILSLMRVVGA